MTYYELLEQQMNEKAVEDKLVKLTIRCRKALQQMDYYGSISVVKAAENLRTQFPEALVNKVVEDYLANYNLFNWNNTKSKAKNKPVTDKSVCPSCSRLGNDLTHTKGLSARYSCGCGYQYWYKWYSADEWNAWINELPF